MHWMPCSKGVDSLTGVTVHTGFPFVELNSWSAEMSVIFLKAEVALKVCGENLTRGCNQCLGLKATSPACDKEPDALSTGAMFPLTVSFLANVQLWCHCQVFFAQRFFSFIHFMCSGFFPFSTSVFCYLSSSGSSTVRVLLMHFSFALLQAFSWVARRTNFVNRFFVLFCFLTFSSAYCSCCLKKVGGVLWSTAACTEVSWALGSTACLCAASPLQHLWHSRGQAVWMGCWKLICLDERVTVHFRKAIAWGI